MSLRHRTDASDDAALDAGPLDPATSIDVPALAVRIGQTIRQLRREAGLSQEAFAHRVGVHRTYMGDIERGAANLSLATLELVAHGLNTSAWELVYRAELRDELSR
jgi:DNA-binding XRE family transcriptional regulator